MKLYSIFNSKFRCQFHQCSTSSLYLPRSQKLIKDWQLDCFFALSGSGLVKAARRTLIKLTSGLNFTNIFMHSFYASSSQKRKISVRLSVSFYSFGIYRRKSCLKNVDEIDPWLLVHVHFAPVCWWNWSQILEPVINFRTFLSHSFLPLLFYSLFSPIISLLLL
jgi:hypothetical protein